MTRSLRPILVSLSLASSGVVLSSAHAQQLQLPQPSPGAKVTATVGLTDITVEYSAPAVKGRPIWGALVPYDQLWRTGANAATKVTFSKDVTIDGKPVAAGSYSWFTIPGKDAWTVVLNKNATASTRDYKEADDVVRVKVKPQEIPLRERLMFTVADQTDDGAEIEVEWEKVRVELPVKVATTDQAQAAIAALEKTAWQPWNRAARWALEAKKDNAMALKLVEKSIAIQEDWQNLWTKAQVLAAQGKAADAYAVAEKAYALGQKAEFFFFEAEVKKALGEWKAAAPAAKGKKK